MAQDTQIDSLVDEIARRVTARLASEPVPTGSCVDSADNDCDSCRGCHVRRPEQVRKLVQLGVDRIAAGTGHQAPASDLAALIDHTLLKPDATKEDLRKVCEEARKYSFATVCVNSVNVRYASAQLEGSSVKPIAVVGFPLGAQTPNAKAYETREAVRNGAKEIDMVINVGALKSKDYALVLEDIAAVVAAAAPVPVKVILETASLNHDEKVIACSLSKISGAAFVKTSTGFGAGGATAEDVALMRAVVGPEMGVKASGGVRTREDVDTMVEAGATRVGASASVAIVSGKTSSKGAARKYASSGGY